jgi:hypothetical protein
MHNAPGYAHEMSTRLSPSSLLIGSQAKIP